MAAGDEQAPVESWMWPAQNRLRPVRMSSNWPVHGFQVCSELTAASKPSHAATRPSASVARWTGVIGHACGAANLPIAVRSVSVGGAGVPATTGASLSARISSRVSVRL